MEDFDKALFVMQRLAGKAGEVHQYQSWPDDFCRREIDELHVKLFEGRERINPSSLTKGQMETLGFRKWDEASAIMLLPNWLYPFLEYGVEVESISGRKIVVREGYELPTHKGGDEDRYIDNDHRFGCLAYGCVPKD